MVQPKTPPLSIRPGVERLAEIKAWATDHGLTPHAAILALIDLGLAGPAAPSLGEVRKRLIGEPGQTFVGGASPITGRLNAAEMASVPKLRTALGEAVPPPKYGSRLKGGKK